MNIEEIPRQKINGMARDALEAAKDYFEDPEVQEKYAAWVEERKRSTRTA